MYLAFWPEILHLVDLGEAGLVAGDAVASDAGGVFALAGLGVTLDFLGMDGGGRKRDSQGKQGRQRFVHFARRIRGV